MLKLKLFNIVSGLTAVLILLSSSQLYAVEQETIDISDRGMQAFRQGNLMLAMELLGQAAQQNYAPAQTTLAYILDQAEENQRAFKLFKQAAETNYAAAQFGLGNMYAKGEGVKKDPLIAGQWIKKSAQQNYRPAMRAYAYALEFGSLGFTQNSSEAFHWYQQCAQANDPVCQRRLLQVYSQGGLQQAADKAKAEKINTLLHRPVEKRHE